MANKSWFWEDENSDWGVEVDEAAGVLHWWGSDKIRQNIPAYAQGGGGTDQTIADLLATRQARYDPPPAILAEIFAEAERIAAKKSGG